VPDRLDVLDSASALRFFSCPARVYLAGRAGRIMGKADFIDSGIKPEDVTNG
jgi:hypothetical protein